jgi:hypothetical protein
MGWKIHWKKIIKQTGFCSNRKCRDVSKIFSKCRKQKWDWRWNYGETRRGAPFQITWTWAHVSCTYYADMESKFLLWSIFRRTLATFHFWMFCRPICNPNVKVPNRNLYLLCMDVKLGLRLNEKHSAWEQGVEGEYLGQKMQKVAGCFRELGSQELRNLYIGSEILISSPSST